jgi:hypothetical protein
LKTTRPNPAGLLVSAPAVIFYCTFAGEPHRAEWLSRRWASRGLPSSPQSSSRAASRFGLSPMRSSKVALSLTTWGAFGFFLPWLAAIYVVVRHGWLVVARLSGMFFAGLPVLIVKYLLA